MLIAEAHVRTGRASRYLDQLCRHASRMGQRPRHRPRIHAGGSAHVPPEVSHVEWSDADGAVSLNWGRWTVQATPDALILRAEASDHENLQRIQDLVAGRLERIGRRDRLVVTWRRLDGDT